MLGNPKYNYGDIVKFTICIEDKDVKIEGSVEVIDAYGTFMQNDEPSYDIMVEDFNGEPCFFKHIRESWIEG